VVRNVVGREVGCWQPSDRPTLVNA